MFSNALYFVTIILFVFATTEQTAENITEDTSTETQDNLNVVLFLAHTDSCLNYEKDGGLVYLNMSLIGKIKPCTTQHESNFPTSFANIIRRSPKKECDCRKLLESSIFSLMGWARNAVGMTTAIVSLTENSNEENKDVGISYYNYKLQIVDASPKPKERVTKNDHNKDDFGQLPLPVEEIVNTDDLPRLENEENEQGFPIINAYPHEPKLKFNDIHKYSKRAKVEDFVNVRRVKRRLIVEPENTQVFEIDTVNEEPSEILPIPLLEREGRPDTIWDLLGMMSAIRKSFFINFLNPMLDPHQRMLDEEHGMDFKSLGEIHAPSLFELVKNTLSNIQRETKESGSKGYLLVVQGGNLSNISNPYSDLVQSVKHLCEISDPERTLIIVTGNCPNNHAHNHTHQMPKDKEEFLMPVYAKGPGSEILYKAKELFDIPLQIKEAIKSNAKEGSVDLETANKNAKLLDLNYVNTDDQKKIKGNSASANDIKNKDKWDRTRMRRNVLEGVPKNDAKKNIIKMYLVFGVLLVLCNL